MLQLFGTIITQNHDLESIKNKIVRYLSYKCHVKRVPDFWLPQSNMFFVFRIIKTLRKKND